MQEREESRGSSVSNNLNREANFDLGRADATSQKILLKTKYLFVHSANCPPSQLQSNVLLVTFLALVMMDQRWR